MDEIKVANIKTFREVEGPWVVYIGRVSLGRPASPLGNPYPVATYGRGSAIAKFAEWLPTQLDQFPVTPAELELDRLVELWRQHQRLTLLCWCTPRPCHGAVIADELRRRVSA